MHCFFDTKHLEGLSRQGSWVGLEICEGVREVVGFLVSQVVIR